MPFNRLILLFGCIALLAACTNLQRLQATPPSTGGTEFTRALARQYRALAADAWTARADFATSEFFAAKAMRAESGEAVPPEELDAWGPWAEVRNDLAEVRARLERLLDRGNRARFPTESAIAQSAFDCWLINASTMTIGGTPWSPSAPSSHFRHMTGQSRSPDQMHSPGCRERFYQIFFMIEPGVMVDYFPFDVYFAAGRWNVDSRGMATVREFAAMARARSAGNVIISGYADTVGAPGANQILSERRANEVRRALIAEGVRANFVVRGLGEANLYVLTPDNTPELRNRRVMIDLR